MIYTSEREDFELTVPDIPVTEYTLRHAERLADKPALIDGPSGRTLTYGELAAGIRIAATGLAACGMGKGDVMGIYCPNIPEYSPACIPDITVSWGPGFMPCIRAIGSSIDSPELWTLVTNRSSTMGSADHSRFSNSTFFGCANLLIPAVAKLAPRQA